MTRVRPRLVAAGLALLLVSAALVGAGAPANLDELDATGDDALTPAVDELSDDVIRYGSGHPGFAVKLQSEDDVASLEDWANSSTVRDIQSRGDGNWTVVSAPKAEIVGGWYWTSTDIGGFDVPTLANAGIGLAERNYVAAVEPQRSIGVDPVDDITGAETYTAPQGAAWLAATTPGVSTNDFENGLAFDQDANLTTLREDRTATGSTDVAADGTGVTVAVIDTGANVKDGELFGNGSTGSPVRIANASKSFVGVDTATVGTAGNYSVIADGNGHGTYVASTIAANTTNAAYRGYAPNATLLVLKALNDDGSGSSDDIAAAIRYAADEDADIASLSLGSQQYSQEIAEAVAYAQAKGTVVVVASGNSRPLFVASPGDTPGPTITVGASNHPDNVSKALPAVFSQGGPDNGQDASNGVTAGQNVTVLAPGMKVEAMVVTESGVLTERSLSGTSMATPQVSGALAQLFDAEPALRGNATLAKQRLTSTARRLPHAAAADAGSGLLAVDRMAANETATQAQTDAMTSEAAARDAAMRAYSESSGGFWFGVADGFLSGLRSEAN